MTTTTQTTAKAASFIPLADFCRENRLKPGPTRRVLRRIMKTELKHKKGQRWGIEKSKARTVLATLKKAVEAAPAPRKKAAPARKKTASRKRAAATTSKASAKRS